MDTLKKQADASIEKMRGIVSAGDKYTFNVTGKLVSQLQDLINKQIQTDLTVLREDAYAQFAIGMESSKNIADINPSGGLSFIDDQAKELSHLIKERYGDLGSAFDTKVNALVTHQKLRYIGDIRAGAKALRLNQASDALHNLSNNANSIPAEELANSIDTLHDAINAEYGKDTGELYAHNTYEISKLRNNIVGGGRSLSETQPPVISTSSPTTELNTKIGTRLRQLQIDNPMLARGFLRIHNMNSEAANMLAQEIRAKYPDSPEAAAIETANRLRSESVQLNALEYGANQLYYSLSSDPVDIFTGAHDHRLDAAQRAYELFGTTNFFTMDERALLKNLPLEAKVAAYAKTDAKLSAYNSKMPSTKKIDPSFLVSEFNKIDGDTVSWAHVVRGFPEFNNISVSQGQAVIESLRKSGLIPKFAVPEQLMRVEGIGGIAEKLAAAYYIQKGDVTGISTFFNTKENYAYAKTYKYGARFQDIAREMLHRNIILVNTGIDTYRVHKLDGTPLIINGSIVQYLGRDLEAVAESKR